MNKWINVKDKLPFLNMEVLAYYYESSGKSNKPLIEGEEIGQLIAKDSESGYPVWSFKTGVLGGGEVIKWRLLDASEKYWRNNEFNKTS